MYEEVYCPYLTLLGCSWASPVSTLKCESDRAYECGYEFVSHWHVNRNCRYDSCRLLSPWCPLPSWLSSISIPLHLFFWAMFCRPPLIGLIGDFHTKTSWKHDPTLFGFGTALNHEHNMRTRRIVSFHFLSMDAVCRPRKTPVSYADNSKPAQKLHACQLFQQEPILPLADHLKADESRQVS